MEDNVFEAKEALVPGRPIKIMERTKAGLLVAEYKGFYNPDKFCVMLYPQYNPFASNNGKTGKRPINAGLIKIVK